MTKTPVKVTPRPCLSHGPLGLLKIREDKFLVRNSSRLRTMAFSGRKVLSSNIPSNTLYIEDNGENFDDVDEQDNTRLGGNETQSEKRGTTNSNDEDFKLNSEDEAISEDISLVDENDKEKNYEDVEMGGIVNLGDDDDDMDGSNVLPSRTPKMLFPTFPQPPQLVWGKALNCGKDLLT
ncbi:hypothetical protein Sjap_001854 [Stephania japonica]|uniref:Uncharacterized protein n=1 Tax=Stephania japonica TaxID=461633 RepID=A0AAP0PTX2_9MAGN